jgi:two-component system, chemotaxis family, CheB/CheR fusion protein
MEESAPEAFNALVDYIRRQRGIDFSDYKHGTLRRRIEKRLHAAGVSSYEEYLDCLQATPQEFDRLLDSLFINVTGFFRDGDPWERIRDAVIPRIVETRSANEQIRVWCAGAASGEEPYSVAMLFAEHLGINAFRDRVKIYATDLDDDVLQIARNATYGEQQVADIPAELLERYFEVHDDRVVFRSDLRRSMIFGRHNLLEDAPISRLDLLLCRNTLMYFNRDAQARVLARFHFALRDEGFLFLGKSEMLLTRRNLFVPVDGRVRIFNKVTQLTFPDRLALLSDGVRTPSGDDPPSRHALLRELAFDTSPIAQILVDTSGNLVLANESARSLFTLVSTDMGRPFQDLEMSYRPLELRSRIQQAVRNKQPVIVKGVERTHPELPAASLDVRVQPLFDTDGAPLAVAISFLDVSVHRDLRVQLEHAHDELEAAYEELQSTNEELETTNEELQSTIEELETTNEELQSTNEELETMNEELQSTNDEMRAINDELRDRTDAVAELNAHMRSIFRSVHAGVVVLDDRLYVETWTERAQDMWGLRAEEVNGKPFLNLDIGLPVVRLKEPMRACLRRDSDYETVVLPCHDRRGRTFECRVTTAPLMGVGDAVSGIILLMEEESRDGARSDRPADSLPTGA